jgi:hypothetical protein
MKFEWIPTSENAETTRSILNEEGAEIKQQLGLGPLSAIGIAAGVAILARVFVRLYKDLKYSGVLIDATTTPIRIKEMPGWPREQVLVVTAEGAKFLEGSKLASIEEVSKLKRLLGEVEDLA